MDKHTPTTDMVAMLVTMLDDNSNTLAGVLHALSLALGKSYYSLDDEMPMNMRALACNLEKQLALMADTAEMVLDAEEVE
jgi:hypothetical protein